MSSPLGAAGASPTYVFTPPFALSHVTVSTWRGLNQTPCNHTWFTTLPTFAASNGTFHERSRAFVGPCGSSPNGSGQIVVVGGGFTLLSPAFRFNSTAAHSVAARFAVRYAASIDVVVPSGNSTSAWGEYYLEAGVFLYNASTNTTSYGSTRLYGGTVTGYGNATLRDPGDFAKGAAFFNGTFLAGNVYQAGVFFDGVILAYSGGTSSRGGNVSCLLDLSSGADRAQLFSITVS